MMENIRKLFCVVFALFTFLSVQAQKIMVTGKITDNEGLEAIGANVTVKGSQGVGTITGLDGSYKLEVHAPDKAVLVFSYIGMKTQEIPVKGRKQIDVVLQPDNQVLEEVVVIGYGTSKRSDLTGSVVSLKSEDLMQTPTSDVSQALAGRVAGVQVMQSEGEPGSSISIRVRGGISITQSNEPLYVIDGFPSEDGMNSLDPAEIETIDILKDASSTAIYGARGANGVVVITTKKGAKEGSKMQLSFDSYVGVKRIARQLPVLSVKEFVLLDYERSLAFKGEAGVTSFQKRYGSFRDIDANYARREGIDWQDEALGRVTTSQNYRVNLTGGGKELKYNFAYSYFNDLGAMLYSGSDKHNISLSVSHSPNKLFQANARFSYAQTKVYGMGTSENTTRFNKMEHILQYRPTVGIYGEDTDLLINEDPLLEDDADNPMQSPLVSAREETKKKLQRVLQVNGGFTLNFNKRLSFRNAIGFRYQNMRQDTFYGAESITGKRASIQGTLQYNESGNFQTSNVLTYKFDVAKHRFALMAGQEWVSYWSQVLSASANNFPNNDIGLNDMSLGIPSAIKSGVNFDDRLLSFFGRVHYNYKEKYLLSATVRGDGSSKFSHNNKWGFFPSVAAAWRLGEEKFIKQLELFSDLKLRLGYGLAGNNRVASYKSLDILSAVGYPSGDVLSPGYAPSAIASKNLKWESNATFNLGVDMGFLEQRIIISPEFYVNKSSNLLLNSRVPSSSGFTNMLRNVGKTRNVGVDLTISTTNIQKKTFTWSTNFNISHNRNRIEALSGEAFFLEEASFGYNQKTHKIEVGSPIGQFYGFRTAGLYQVSDFDYDASTGSYTLKEGVPAVADRASVQPGMWKFADVTPDGVIDENDKTIIGNALPDFYGGLNNTFKYKDWDFSLFFTFSYGAEVLNATKLTNSKAGKTNYNVLDLVNSSKRWMTINADGKTVTDPVELAALNAGRTVASIWDMQTGNTYIHSWAVEDASYLRLSNLSIGYTFPRKALKKVGLQKLRFYFTGSNLFVWTPYTGFDPEVSTMGNSLTPGVDFGAYPRNRSFVFGLNVTL